MDIGIEIPVFQTVILALFIVTIFKSIKLVPVSEAWVVERLGRFKVVLEPGLNLIMPFFDRVAYKHNLKDQSLDIITENCLTKDDIKVKVYSKAIFRIIDPKQASYGLSNPYLAITQLAQVNTRSEISNVNFETALAEKKSINKKILNELNKTIEIWGVEFYEYEVKDIVKDRLSKATDMLGIELLEFEIENIIKDYLNKTKDMRGVELFKPEIENIIKRIVKK